MLRLLRTRRWLSFTALVLLVIIAFGFLSRWQWSRAEAKRDLNASMMAARSADPIASSMARSEWTPVIATGTYDQEHEVVVRKRPQDAINGFWVLTPLVTDSGTIWVNRGWIRAAGTATTYPTVPPPPNGTVTVTGLWRFWEKATTVNGLPAGMISDVDPDVLPASTNFLGYVQLTQSQPEQLGLDAILLPEIDDSKNISYAVQWILFALVCIGGWYFFLRREAREDAQVMSSEG